MLKYAETTALVHSTVQGWSHLSDRFLTPGPRLEEPGSGVDVKMKNKAGKASQIFSI